MPSQVDLEDCFPEQWLDSDTEKLFPRLNRSQYCVTSKDTEGYNCIAWAAGENWRCWWPINSSFYTVRKWPETRYYWPDEAPCVESLEAFIKAYELLGYESCENREVEAGFEKIAVYVDIAGTPTHAARQLPSGKWTSKLGDYEDIKHDTLEALETDGVRPAYGKVAQIMKRLHQPEVPNEETT